MNDFIQSLSDEFNNIYFIQGQINGRYPYSHSFMIGDYLIDTGISKKFLRRLKKQFSISKVIFSHWHEDHIRDALFMDAEYYCHIKDKSIIEDINKFLKKCYCIVDTPAENLFDSLLDILRLKNIKINHTINDNELIDIGENYQLKVIHTPGHTAGHCCFYEENSKIAFLADIDLTRFIFYGCVDSNLIDYEKSIEKMEKLDIEIAVSGHRGVFRGSKTIKKELENYKLIIYKNDERLLSHLSEKNPLNPQDLIKKNIIYKNYSEWKEFEIIAEKIMIQKHFDKFLKNNVIEPKNNGYVLS